MIGARRLVSFPGTDLYCVTIGGQGPVTYDILFRAATYPPGIGDGSVISEVITRTFFNSHSTPAGGLNYAMDGCRPLTPIIAPDSTAHVTLMPLVGSRSDDLFRMASILKLNTDDIHFILVLQAPMVISTRLSSLSAEFGSSQENPIVYNHPPDEDSFNHWFCAGCCNTGQCINACDCATEQITRHE